MPLPDPDAADRGPRGEPPATGRDRPDCPVDRTLRLLGGKWRLMVLFHLGAGPVRWGALRRDLAPITARVLTATLRALEGDGLIWRRAEETVPPVVTYGLTARGAALAPIFEAMAAWGAVHSVDAARHGDGPA